MVKLSIMKELNKIGKDGNSFKASLRGRSVERVGKGHCYVSKKQLGNHLMSVSGLYQCFIMGYVKVISL